MAFFSTQDGTQIYYNDWGTGKPVVLVGGWPLDGDMWEYQSVFLAERGYRVITYDRRGFGRSSQPWNGYDYDTMTADLAGLIEHLDLREITLVGFSMGGGEVVRYAARHGTDRLARVVLVSSVTPYLLAGPTNEDGIDRSVFDQMIDGLRADRPGFFAKFGKGLYGAGMLNFTVGSDFLQWSGDMAMLASPRATLACVRTWSETDFRADVPHLTVPTLIIHGGADATVPLAASAQKMVGLLPHAELHVYDGAPHGLFYTERDRLNNELIAFIEEG